MKLLLLEYLDRETKEKIDENINLAWRREITEEEQHERYKQIMAHWRFETNRILNLPPDYVITDQKI